MNIWLKTSLLLGVVSFAAYAVEPFSLPTPLNPAALHSACLTAFDQTLADKEAYESQPQVNLKCASQLEGAQVEEIKAYFVGICENGARSKENNDAGKVEMNDVVLKGEFDTAYGGVFRGHCLDTAVNAFNQANAASQTYASSGAPASAASDGCYAFSGCR